MPSHLYFGNTVQGQRSDPAVPKEARSRERLHKPKPESVLLVQGEITGNPHHRFASCLRARVEAHLILVCNHGCQVVEILAAELTQFQTLGYEDRCPGADA